MAFNPGDTATVMMLMGEIERRDKVIVDLRDLLEQANAEIARLRDVEFWYNRMRDV